VFIRENRNRSGAVSIQVIEKQQGRNRVVFSAGSGRTLQEIELLKVKAQSYIDQRTGALSLFVEQEDVMVQAFVESLSGDNLRIVGPQMVLEPLFEQLFPGIVAKHFRDLVLCRVIYPGSKLRTVDYLSRHFKTHVSAQTIYRSMDQLDDSLKKQIEDCVFRRAKSLSCQDELSLVFYDMTTLYFETESEDDLRRIGYSKDGKHQHPQIMIGLLVTASGFPIAYDVFEGNQSETKTLIPVIERLVTRFSIAKPVVIADAALLSKKNLDALQQNGYEYILGGRIKNESAFIRNEVLSLCVTEDQPKETPHPYGRLVVSYSDKRSAKDSHNRQKGLQRLEKKVKSKKLTKDAINNRGYNKYLKPEGETKVSIDYELFNQDAVWDGLKGYLTNTKLSAKLVIAAYGNLWQVEKAFRMSKTDLRFRPIYHRKERRIKSHLIICFASYALLKTPELKIRRAGIDLSVQKAVDELKGVQELTYRLPKSRHLRQQMLKTNPVQKMLMEMKI
jgi:transposase